MVYYLCAGSIGLLVGAGEIVARYRDEPSKAVLTIPGVLYCALNVIVTLLALYMIEVFGLSFGAEKPEQAGVLRVLAAGFGGMAIFRSSIFNARVGDSDVGIGPAGLLQILLAAADRAVDRRRATQRSASVAKIMEGVSFAKSQAALPAVCLVLMQNLPREEQEALAAEVLNLRGNTLIDEAAKSLSLGLVLTKYVGEEVLAAAVRSLGKLIR